jgi:Putative adhesin
MKNLKFSLCGIFILLTVLVSQAQEFKVNVKSGSKVKIRSFSGSMSISTHSGNEVIIKAPSIERPKNSEGLRLISGRGEDNTGVGLNVQSTESGLEISGATRKSVEYEVLLPENIALHAHLRGWQCSKLEIDGLKSEVEIDVDYASVYLNNVTGPVVLKVTYGKVKANFSQVNQTKPISLIATYSDLDVTLPSNTKANIKLHSDYGDIYSDFDIAYEKKSGDADWIKMTGSSVKGTINGGGVEIYLKAPYNNVYLRKSK